MFSPCPCGSNTLSIEVIQNETGMVTCEECKEFVLFKVKYGSVMTTSSEQWNNYVNKLAEWESSKEKVFHR